MKSFKTLLFYLFMLLTPLVYSQVGIGTTTPDANAQLDITSTERGLLIPRLSGTQVTSLQGTLTATQKGMLVYNSTENCIQMFNGTAFECLTLNSSVMHEWNDSTGYIIAADALNTGDTVVVTDDGRIGVNTTSPSYHIEVVHTDAPTLSLISTDDGGGWVKLGNSIDDDAVVLTADEYTDPGLFSKKHFLITTEDELALSSNTKNITAKTESTSDILLQPGSGFLPLGDVGIGVYNATKRLHINASNDSLRFENLAGTGSLLGIDADGKVFKYDPSNNNLSDVVLFDINADPNTAGTTFNPNTPIATDILYVSEIDGSTWIWDGSMYITQNVSVEPWFNATTNGQANGLTQPLYHLGSVRVGTGDASGKYAFTSGINNIAIGFSSIAMGTQSVADGNNAFALGIQDTARGNGNGAWAIGYQVRALGGRSVAMGSQTTASALMSTAMGRQTTASGRYSTAMGAESVADADYAFAVGYQDTARGAGNGAWAIGYQVRALGDRSVAMGSQSTASAFTSTAMGNNTMASGVFSTALGNNTTASGSSSFATGRNTFATGNHSIALGYEVRALGARSVATGFETTAGGDGSTAMGYQTTASGVYSTALGNNTTASGGSSFATGRNTSATGDNSTALGFLISTSGSSSIGLGNSSEASGVYSGVLGFHDTATANNSWAIGRQNRATATNAIAMGFGNTASGTQAMALGYQTIASGTHSVAIGEGIESSGTNTMAISLNNQTGTDVSQDNTLAIMGGTVGIGTATPTSSLTVNGAVAKPITTISTATVLDNTHHTIILTPASPINLTLPAASAAPGRIYTFMNRTIHTVSFTSVTYLTASGTGNDIGGFSTLKLQSDGTNWYRIE